MQVQVGKKLRDEELRLRRDLSTLGCLESKGEKGEAIDLFMA